MFFLGLAMAQEGPRVWEGMYDALLVEAADGTPAIARQYYQELLQDLPEQDPMRGPILYWLGRSYALQNQFELATPLLQESMNYVSSRSRAEALLAWMDARQRGAALLPIHYDFSQGVGALQRFWSKEGSLEVSFQENNSILAWQTEVVEGHVDRLILPLSSPQSLRSVSLLAKSTSFPASLQVLLTTPEGHRYSSPLSIIPTGDWLQLRLPLSAFRPLDGNAKDSISLVQTIEIQDLTGYLSSDRGLNTLLMDDLSVQ